MLRTITSIKLSAAALLLAATGIASADPRDMGGPRTELTVDGQSYIVAVPGQQVFYSWHSEGAETARSWYTVSGNGPCTSNHGGNWVASSTEGQLPSTIGTGQVGCSYLITLAVYDHFGRSSQSTITVQVVGGDINPGDGGTIDIGGGNPDTSGRRRHGDLRAHLTVDGQSLVYAHPGEQVFYQWESEGGVSARSWYTVSGSGSCTSNHGGAWAVSSLEGQLPSTINGNQRGCAYLITYEVFDQEGRSVQDTITVVVQ